MSQTQPCTTNAVDDFFEWESRSKIAITSTADPSSRDHFLSLHLLQTYFSSNNYTNLHALLSGVFNSDYPPIDPESIVRDHAAIFCILLHLGKGELIEHFARFEGLSDQRLPFEREHPPKDFPYGEDGSPFLGEFCDTQQPYCVPVFDAHMLHKHFGAKRLLPITKAEARGKEGSAETYAVQVYEPYNELVSSENLHESNTYMLKIYQPGDENDYRDEVNGFRAVRNTESIIKFHGSYIHGEDFHILLEYADKGTLEEFFQRETPPSRGLDIIQFWEALFQLIQGLKTIHSVRGGHGDMSPKTIFVVNKETNSRSDWSFKFASFGSRTAATDIENNVENFRLYDAPESSNPISSEQTDIVEIKSWPADIWSLGCLYSEAAMWIADGHKGITDFRTQRMEERAISCGNDLDSFHDGMQVLQSVLEAHKNIEDRLRRSDYITKDVLDSMVDEMLWEEDRPTAKALWRKAEMVISRARTKLSSTETLRPESRQNSYPPPIFQPPNQPLPQIPRAISAGSSPISERQRPGNVERWRSHIHVSTGDHLSPNGSDSNIDRGLNGSIASWQMRDSTSQASSLTPLTSPHVSLYFNPDRHSPNEGLPRTAQSSSTYEDRKPNSLSRTLSHTSYPQELYLRPRFPAVVNEEEGDGVSSAQTIAEMRTRARAASRAGSSRHSSYSFSIAPSPTVDPQTIQIPTKSAKRGPSLSLFPAQSYQYSPPPNELHPTLRVPPYNADSVPRSVAGFENTNSISPPPSRDRQPAEYLSTDTCLEWKRAHKKTKKSKVPPLPGMHILDDLQERDHIFIIDDSSSMAPHWPDLDRTFEALSHLVKGMSTDGTELFYTVSYDTYQRKDTFELSAYVEKKTTAGKTNIAYRIDLQLQSYRAKIINGWGKKLKKGQKGTKPMSMYILTNGEWRGGKELTSSLKDMAAFLKAEGMETHLMIEFISFAQNPRAAQRVSDLAGIDFGLDILDCERWDGNMFRMLKGSLDRTRFPRADINEGTGFSDVASSTSTWPHARTRSSGIIELA